jgi:hypothetical protein
VGGIGLAVATPLIAGALVVVKILYVRDVIGDPVDVPRPSARGSTSGRARSGVSV